MPASLEEQLCAFLREDDWRISVLKAVRDLRLPDSWTGAGFIRSFVWDKLTGLEATVPEDVDVIYYDASNTSEAREKEYDARLKAFMPDVPWSCKNQARMHLKAGLTVPYADTADGLRHWTETATAVAARLDDVGQIRILAPFGLDDLLSKTVRPTPFFKDGRMDLYRARLRAKNWPHRWPDLMFIE